MPRKGLSGKILRVEGKRFAGHRMDRKPFASPGHFGQNLQKVGNQLYYQAVRVDKLFPGYRLGYGDISFPGVAGGGGTP